VRPTPSAKFTTRISTGVRSSRRIDAPVNALIAPRSGRMPDDGKSARWVVSSANPREAD
jgi:hypothetical protein